MSLSIMGSVSSYTKTMRLQTQWNLKQQNGDYSSHKKNLEDWISNAREELKKSERSLYTGPQEEDEQSRNKLRNIQQKVYAGKKLTQKERQYLQAKDPQTYEKLKATEQEQKAYEQQLRRCRTKEDVQRLKMTHLASSLATVNEVAHNSRIPLNKKLEICMQEKLRCDKLEASTRAFVQSGEYDRLPTQAEEAKANKEEREQKQVHKKPRPTVKPSKPEQPEKAETDLELNPDPAGRPQLDPGQTSKPEAESSAARQIATAKGSQSVGVKPAAAQASRPQAGDSPELRKVRRARRNAARAAYSAAAATAAPVAAPQPQLSVQA